MPAGAFDHSVFKASYGQSRYDETGWLGATVVTFHGHASDYLDGVGWVYTVHLMLGITLFLFFSFHPAGAYIKYANGVCYPPLSGCAFASLIT